MKSDNYELDTAITLAKIITSLKGEIEKLDEVADTKITGDTGNIKTTTIHIVLCTI
jgi:hypothetical protein